MTLVSWRRPNCHVTECHMTLQVSHDTSVTVTFEVSHDAPPEPVMYDRPRYRIAVPYYLRSVEDGMSASRGQKYH